ncbi:MAG: IS200/IS605 family transposase [Bacteroidetes bacterium]|nr:IS200/IS605 family transposase [Bacteroidota bacterium]
MSLHSYSKVWLHLIWSTHNKEKVLLKDVRKQVSKFLYSYAEEKEIYMRTNYVNAEHVHALIDLPTTLSIDECLKLLKGSSSHYINDNRLVNNKFRWARGYGAFSVSESQLKKVVDYINNQEEHHRAKSFTEEYELFMKKYGIKYVKNG